MKNKFTKNLVKIGFISCMIGASASFSYTTLPSCHTSSAYHRINDVSYTYDSEVTFNFFVNEHYTVKCTNDIYFINVNSHDCHFTLRYNADSTNIFLTDIYISYSLGISSIDDDTTFGYYDFAYTYFTYSNIGDIEHGCLSDYFTHSINMVDGSLDLRRKSSYIDYLTLDNNHLGHYNQTGLIDDVPNRTITYIYDFYNVVTKIDISNFFDIFANSITNSGDTYDEGYANGYNVGYQVGMSEGDNNLKLLTLMRAVFESPGYMLHNMFNFELFGVNIFGVVSFFITIGIVLLVFSILRRTK